MRAEFRVLGPLEVRLDGNAIPVPAGQARVLLATLLLRANRFVSVDELIDRLWDGAPPNPQRAKTTLQMVVTRLRQALGGANCVRTMTGGYLAEADDLDVTRFRALAAGGSLAEALSLWRGPVLANVASESLHRDDVPLLLEERLVVLERRIQADLERGDGGGLVPELRSLTREHPLRERFWGQLMVALYRAGQQADALAAYRAISGRLADELGVDPGPDLRDLHQRVLNAEESLLPDTTPAAEVAIPRQLPPALATFVGREQDVSRLDRGTAQVIVISGTGGVGKTALAVHWAHRVRNRFPDGQIFLNLRGQDPGRVMTAIEAVSRVLRGLGVQTAAVPLHLDEQVAMYRSLISERAVLLVLDNAAGPEQVRPLVPTSPASRLVVTSRSDLRGLLALNDAELVRLTTLGETDAADLLVRILGVGRVTAEPEAVRELVRLCAGLPLALRIAAADLAMRPGSTIASLVEALTAGDRLARLAVPGDPEAAVAVVFAESYATLTEDTRLVFRRLGLVPGADFTANDAAVVAALPLSRTQELLDRLVGAHLVEKIDDGRFTLHDLLRIYARDRCEREDVEADRDQALDRLLDWYLRVTDLAAELLYADLTRMPVVTSSVQMPEFGLDGVEEAFAWLRAEQANLLAALVRANTTGRHAVASQLASTLNGFYYQTRDDTGWAVLCEQATRAAESSDEGAARAAALFATAIRHLCRSDLPRGAEAAEDMAKTSRTVGDPRWEACAENVLGSVNLDRREYVRAAEHFRRSLALRENAGSARGKISPLLNLAVVSWELGRLPDVLALLNEAAAIAHAAGGFEEEAHCVMSLCATHMMLGNFDESLRYFEQHREMQHDMKNNYADPSLLVTAGELHLGRGHLDEAYEVALEALENTRGRARGREEVGCWGLWAMLANAVGEHKDAVRFATLGVHMARDEAFGRERVSLLLVLAQSYRLVGDPIAATRQLDEARALIDQHGQHLHEGNELAERALICLSRDEVDDALRLAIRSVEVHRETAQRYREAKSLQVLADVRRALGQEEIARECSVKAAELLAVCGVAAA